jgi:hypothetical protein
MRRIVLLIAIAIVATAAPARAWCEASCLAPADDVQAHCPSHDPASATTEISSSATVECPVLESARPAAAARFDAQVIAAVTSAPPVSRQSFYSPSATHSGSATTVFERCTPLRI